MKIYSPSSTTTFIRCPSLWYATRILKIEPKRMVNGDVAKFIGSAYGYAIGKFYLEGQNLPSKDVGEIAANHYSDSMRSALARGRSLAEYDEKATKTDLQAPFLLKKMVDKWFENPPIPASWSVTTVERPMEDAGYARIDLGGRTASGVPYFADIKCTTYCRPGDVANRFANFENNWQMNHYAKFYSDVVGEPVRQYMIPLVVFGPTQFIEVRDFVVDSGVLERWYMSAQQWWGQMEYWETLYKTHGSEAVLTTIPTVDDHSGYKGYGKCSMYEFCFTHQFDTSTIHDTYIQIEHTSKGGK